MFPLDARRFASRKDVIVRRRFREAAGPPNQSRIRDGIQGDNPSTPSLCSCAPYGQGAPEQVYLAPTQRANLVLPERRIERKRYHGAEQVSG